MKYGLVNLNNKKRDNLLGSGMWQCNVHSPIAKLGILQNTDSMSIDT
jgi:hypothetical protein